MADKSNDCEMNGEDFSQDVSEDVNGGADGSNGQHHNGSGDGPPGRDDDR